MSRTRSILTAAVAALLVAAPTATANPVDAHAGFRQPAKATTTQDLRSPDARDAANRGQSPTSSLAGTTSPRHTHPQRAGRFVYVQPRELAPASEQSAATSPSTDARPVTPVPAANTTDEGHGVARTTIVLGIAGGLLALAGLAAVTRRRHGLRAAA